jgi:hypothetical protein
MKRVIFYAFLMALGGVAAFSQEAETKPEPEGKSNATIFLSTSGTFIKKEYHPIGTAKAFDFEVLVLTDVLSSEKMACLKIKTIAQTPSQPLADEYADTLDADEVEECIKSLMYIKNNLMASKPQVYTECEYRSREGLKFGAFWNSRNTWSVYFYMNAQKSFQSLSAADLDAMLLKLIEAKAKIESLTGTETPQATE